MERYEAIQDDDGLYVGHLPNENGDWVCYADAQAQLEAVTKDRHETWKLYKSWCDRAVTAEAAIEAVRRERDEAKEMQRSMYQGMANKLSELKSTHHPMYRAGVQEIIAAAFNGYHADKGQPVLLSEWQWQEIRMANLQAALDAEREQTQLWKERAEAHEEDHFIINSLKVALYTAQARVKELEERLYKYDHWTPEHTIEQWLANRQAIVEAKQVAADAQLQAQLRQVRQFMTDIACAADLETVDTLIKAYHRATLAAQDAGKTKPISIKEDTHA